MALASRLLSLFSLSSIAVLICSLHTTPVAALSVDHAARALSHPAHDALAKRKRSSTSKRCKPRPAPSSASSSAAPSSAPPTASSTPSPSPSPSASSSAQQSSATSAPSASVSSSQAKNGKAGTGWANGPDHLDLWAGLLNTIYTWNPACPNNAQSLGITCCPMLWGWNQVGQWTSEVMGTSPECVMGPNEPEISGQSNMDPQSAVQLWFTYIHPMKAKGSKLISPATTSDPQGKDWMVAFLEQCGPNCDIDYVALHWYDVSGDDMIAYLNDRHTAYGHDLWLTEFACQNFNGGPQCTMDDIWAFQGKVTPFLKQTSWIAMYMPFGAMQDLQGVNPENSLMGADFKPNALALAYFS